MSRNLSASIRARLKNHADATKQEFNLTLTHYADLLAFGADDIDAMVGTFREICAIPCEDGIAFDPASVRGFEIRKPAGYGGVRIELQARLDGACISLQADIGFGDAVTPAPLAMRYPVLLDGLPVPELRAYPKPTVVAEKLHAICVLGMANTRMKDFFDLDILLAEEALDPVDQRRAIEATFARRKFPMPRDWPVGLTDVFADDAVKKAQWLAFLRKNRLKVVSLPEVVARVRMGLARLGPSDIA